MWFETLVGGYLMKSILVYGDSLAWGRNASNRDRHKYEDRWPSVLGESLKNVKVWEAGLGGRTTNLNFPGLPGRKGAGQGPRISDHAPRILDL